MSWLDKGSVVMGAPTDLEKRAAAGDAGAQFSLGVAYANGQGVPKDDAKAVEWYKKAAEQGNADAQFNLGVLYANGEGVPKDAAKAVEWCKRAAEQGFADAQFILGVAYANGEGVPKDAAKAVEWYKKAAEQGNALAQNSLGRAYLNGKGVPKDAAKAVEWYKRAAEQGFADAQNNLGVAYDNGQGVPKDDAKAVEWYKKAAEQGEANAQFNLGRAYYHGVGVPKDWVLAYAWSNLAATSLPNSKAARDHLAQSMSPGQVAEAQRLASNWKPGDALRREGSPQAPPAAAPEPAGPPARKGSGTAFVVSAQGHVVTNHHVVDGCAELRLPEPNAKATVLTADTVNDLALLKLDGGRFASVAPLAADPGKLRQGDDIVVFGFPLRSALSSEGNVTPGVVSALTGLGDNTSQIQITAPVQPGSSGSPVLNAKGEVIGVVSMKLSDAVMAKATGQVGQNVNFAVGGLTLKAFLDAHQVPYQNGAGFFAWTKNSTALADEARQWTFQVECWK